MIVMAHHLGEDQLIQALLGAGGTLSVALIAASTKGSEADRTPGKGPLTARGTSLGPGGAFEW
jgi:hypothetical protein